MAHNFLKTENWTSVNDTALKGDEVCCEFGAERTDNTSLGCGGTLRNKPPKQVLLRCTQMIVWAN